MCENIAFPPPPSLLRRGKKKDFSDYILGSELSRCTYALLVSQLFTESTLHLSPSLSSVYRNSSMAAVSHLPCVKRGNTCNLSQVLQKQTWKSKPPVAGKTTWIKNLAYRQRAIINKWISTCWNWTIDSWEGTLSPCSNDNRKIRQLKMKCLYFRKSERHFKSTKINLLNKTDHKFLNLGSKVCYLWL